MSLHGTISGSVGEKGKNLRNDVSEVQGLLKSRGFDPGPVDGICGQKTIAAIRKFQSGFLSHPDGLIEPGKFSWQKLIHPSGPQAPSRWDWSGDSAKWTQGKKLASMTPALRPKVQGVLDALRKWRFQPKTSYGWRSVAVQLHLFQLGNTTVKFSFHNAQKPDGTPNAYAADIVDERYGWDAQAASSGYWKALGEEAKAFTAVRAGLREGEIAALQWGDVQFGDGKDDSDRYVVIQRLRSTVVAKNAHAEKQKAAAS